MVPTSFTLLLVKLRVSPERQPLLYVMQYFWPEPQWLVFLHSLSSSLCSFYMWAIITLDLPVTSYWFTQDIVEHVVKLNLLSLLSACPFTSSHPAGQYSNRISVTIKLCVILSYFTTPVHAQHQTISRTSSMRVCIDWLIDRQVAGWEAEDWLGWTECTVCPESGRVSVSSRTRLANQCYHAVITMFKHDLPTLSQCLNMTSQHYLNV